MKKKLILANTCFLYAIFLIQLSYAQQVDFFADSVCFGDYTRLEADTSGISQYTNLAFSWDLDNDGSYDGIDDKTGRVINYMFDETGYLNVGLRVSSDELTDEVVKRIRVYPNPEVNFTVDDPCAGEMAQFTSTSTGGGGSIVNYYWDFYNNTISVQQGANLSSVTYNYGSEAATYTVRLTVKNDKNCSAYTLKTVSVNPRPVANFTYENTCFNDTILFTNTSTIQNDNINHCIWQYGDKIIETTSGDASHRYKLYGNFYVTMIAVSDNNCNDTIKDVTVLIHPTPVLELKYNDNLWREGETIKLEAEGIFDEISWSTGEVTNSIIIDTAGTYSVEVFNSFGCDNSASVTIIEDTSALQIDSAQIRIRSKILTPNGDGVNDHFEVRNLNQYEKCELAIFNIYGDIVYENKTYDNSWDGGNLAPGSYFYMLTTDYSTKKGSISILR